MFQFKGGISQTDITIATNSERALIDSMVIYRGDGSNIFTNAKVIDVSGEPQITEGEIEDKDLIAIATKTTDNVRGNSYLFEDLKPDTFYSFAVKAYNAIGESQMSEKYVLKTGDAAVISLPLVTDNAATTTYTLDGQRMDRTGKTGLFIIKKGNEVKKIIIR